MTHRVLGVRAERVVAHGPAPRGFLVHGGDSTLWTAYLNGGVVPRGEIFAFVVREIAGRAGVDTAPIDQTQPRDRASALLQGFFALCSSELDGRAGAAARAYLEQRGFPLRTIDNGGLGVLADGRWPGRLCGAWRDERGTIRTLWARSLRDSDSSTRYLYPAERPDLDSHRTVYPRCSAWRRQTDTGSCSSKV